MAHTNDEMIHLCPTNTDDVIHYPQYLYDLLDNNFFSRLSSISKHSQPTQMYNMENSLREPSSNITTLHNVTTSQTRVDTTHRPTIAQPGTAKSITNPNSTFIFSTQARMFYMVLGFIRVLSTNIYVLTAQSNYNEIMIHTISKHSQPIITKVFYL